MIHFDLMHWPEMIWVILFGLSIGSFINVLVYRLPLQLEKKWTQECQIFLKLPPTPTASEINWVNPLRSICPMCKSVIPFYYNIPLLSYFILRGKCDACKQPIPWYYPAIETLSAAGTLLCYLYFGFTLKGAEASFLIWICLVITCIDLKSLWLPDELTLLLLWAGLIFNTVSTWSSPDHAILGAALGYLSLKWFTSLYQRIRKKNAMGQGDFKLFAAFGAWFGPSNLPLLLLIAAALGATIGSAFLIFKKQHRDTPIPFGPFLCLSALYLLFTAP
jgi:leader peptidase (prepilin peptidase)/N-methyltransferase